METTFLKIYNFQFEENYFDLHSGNKDTNAPRFDFFTHIYLYCTYYFVVYIFHFHFFFIQFR